MTAEDQSPPSRERLDEIRNAVVTPMATLAALELGVFTALGNGAMTGQALADALSVRPRRLEMLLYQLVVSDLLVLEDGLFANQPIAQHYLNADSADFVGAIDGLWREQFHSQMQTTESIRTDKPQAKIDFVDVSEDDLSAFLKGLHGMTVAAGRSLASRPQFAEAKTLVDCGCGSAGIAVAACEEHPGLKATATDLPTVIPVADEMIAEAGLSNRISTAPVDIVNESPSGPFDIATARSLFQVLSAEQCRKAAKNIGAAIRSGGTLFIVGHILDDTRLAPAGSVGLNLAFLNVFDDGQSYTESEYFSWLSDAGFEAMTREPLMAGSSLITARKKQTFHCVPQTSEAGIVNHDALPKD